MSLKSWIGIVAWLAAGGAHAQALPPLLVCYDDVFVPFFMPGGETYTGLTADIVAEAGRRAGIAVHFQQLPWRRLESELAHGAASKVDCAFALSRTAQREQTMTYGHVPVLPTEFVLFVRADASQLQSVDDLKGKTIGVRAGIRIPDSLAKGVAAGLYHVAEVGSDVANFQKLMLGRVDAVLADSTVGLYTLRQQHITEVRRLQPPLERYDTYLVFSKKPQGTALAAAFDHALEQMQKDGTLERLKAIYLGPATANRMSGQAEPRM